MKKILFSLMSLLLAIANPIAAQKAEYTNPYGVRLVSEEIIHYESSLANIDDDANNGGKRKSPAYATVDAEKMVISYMSLDGKKDSVRLSATIYIKPNHNYDKLLLNCHPTVTSNFEAPTGAQPVDADIRRICDDNFLVVCPDYCGYGFSSYKQHPYLIHDVTAKNCVDAAMAALDYIQNVRKYQPSGNHFTTYIVGYSQGGATALACAKYLESEVCPDNVKNRLSLKETCCGDGPYSTVATVNKYIEWGKEKNAGGKDQDLEYPCVLPLIVAAAKEAYGEGCMRTVEVEDYFSEEFKETGIIELIKNKDMTTVDLNSEIRSKMKGRLRPVDVFSENMIDKATRELKKESNVYKCLIRAMQTNELAKGWSPKHPLTFFHLKQDGVVPYANLEEIQKVDGIKNTATATVTIVDPEKVYDQFHWYNSIVAIFSPPPAWNEANHAEGGTLFYTGYMFGDLLHK